MSTSIKIPFVHVQYTNDMDIKFDNERLKPHNKHRGLFRRIDIFHQVANSVNDYYFGARVPVAYCFFNNFFPHFWRLSPEKENGNLFARLLFDLVSYFPNMLSTHFGIKPKNILFEITCIPEKKQDKKQRFAGFFLANHQAVI